MRKTLSFLLVLVLIAGLLSVGAAAAGTVMLSKQNLRADGVTIACEKYNIDGSNYFKLRDVACLVNGTGSQFSVGYDSVKRVISIVTGEAYEPNGSEMDLSGGDKSASAVPSTQTILIDGKERSDLSVYNIGGNNYFKLRDLGTALGFKVDYDKASNTAIIISKRASAVPDWLVEERIYSTNDGYTSRSVTVYDNDGRVVSYTSDGQYSTETSTYTYDELGRTKACRTESHVKDGDGSEDYWSLETWEYDIWGNLTADITEEIGDVITENLYTYDEYGRETTHIYRSNYGEYVTRTTYDRNGFIIRLDETDYDGGHTATVYERDAQGNILHAKRTDDGGNVLYEDEYTYDQNGRVLKNVYTHYYSGEESRYVYTYKYDSRGNQIHAETRSPYYSDTSDYIYDKGDRLVRIDTQSTYGDYTNLFQYDDKDRQIRSEYIDADGGRRICESIYEGDRLVKDTMDDNGALTVTEYSYDDAARKMTVRTTVTYPLPTAMAMSEESAALAVGGEYYLYVSYTPENAVYEHVEWSSSDPAVAAVDEYGVVTGVAPGTATITAVSDSGLTAACRVTVAEHKFTFTAEPQELTVAAGKTKAVQVSLEHVGDWVSSTITPYIGDPSIVSTSWGSNWNRSDNLETTTLYVKGLAAGKTSITLIVTHEGMEDSEVITISVTVTA